MNTCKNMWAIPGHALQLEPVRTYDYKFNRLMQPSLDPRL